MIDIVTRAFLERRMAEERISAETAPAGPVRTRHEQLAEQYALRLQGGGESWLDR